MGVRGLAVFLLLLSVLETACAKTLIARYDPEEIAVDASRHDLEFFRFVTRPDLDAPRWEIRVYNESALAPGFWFVAPYGIVEQTDNQKAYVAPHIYDSRGELVWSGAALFARYNTFTFAVSDVRGRRMLTVLYPHGEHALLIDSRYGVHAEVYVGVSRVTTNMHELQMVDNGTRALYLTKSHKRTSVENSLAVGFEGHCFADFSGFEERDVESGEITFTWSSEGRIGLDESATFHDGGGEHCDGEFAWDWLHLNSVEKLDNGDYLVSGRRTYAIYRISHLDGSVLWRLGGKKSDFRINGHFSGQHDVRCLFQNDTHLLLSIMDNAKGPGPPTTTNPYSRGLILSVDTETMTAVEVTEFRHPHEQYAFQRGGFQILPNGNAFCSWTQNTLISEHTSDGALIAEARFPSHLKTYRGYKYPWIARPDYPPDVVSRLAVIHGVQVTVVHVSWNGATEVSSWKLYRSHANGNTAELLRHVRRSGFETAIVHEDNIPYVSVQGIDKQGHILGRSRTVQTRDASDIRGAPRSEEVKWQRKHIHATALIQTWDDFAKSLIGNPTVTFVGGVILAALVAICVSLGCKGRRKSFILRPACVWWKKYGSRPYHLRGAKISEDERLLHSHFDKAREPDLG